MEIEYKVVNLVVNHTKLLRNNAESIEPDSRLLKTINRLLKLRGHNRRLPLSYKPRGLLYINLFDFTFQEGILNV